MKSKNSGKDFCIFGLPGLFCFFAVVIVPFVYGVYLTMTDWDGVATKKNFIGAANFLGVVRDGQFWTSLLLTFQYVIVVVLLVNVFAFAIAYLLTRGIKGQNFFRAGFFTPNLIGGIVLGYIWQFVFSRAFVNIGESTGWDLFEISWLSTPGKAFGLYDSDLRRRVYGIERRCYGSGKYRRRFRLEKDGERRRTADDVVHYNLSFPDIIACVYGI